MVDQANGMGMLYVNLLNGKSVDEVVCKAGYRIVRLGWKGNAKEGRVAHAARYVEIEKVGFRLEGPDLQFVPMLQDAFAEHQKMMLHRYVTEQLDRFGECVTVPAEKFSKDAVFADWDSEASEDAGSSRGKLSKDAILVWYERELSEAVAVKLIENAMSAGSLSETASDAELERFQRQAVNYGKVLALLASPKPAVTVEQGKMLSKALDLAPACKTGNASSDPVIVKLRKKLDVVMNPVTQEDVLASL